LAQGTITHFNNISFEVLLLNIESWDLTSFFEYGSSPLTKAVKDILNLKQLFSFIPQYVVLKSDLNKEGSVYITLENATDALFYFFPFKYPGSAHYKMIPTELQIHGCENYNKCEELLECEKAVFNIPDENLEENVIFISWKLFETKTLLILMQYKNKFVQCRHHKPHLQIQKLVMYGSKRQSFGIIDGVFRLTKQENNQIKLNRSFNLLVNASVSMHTFQCFDCKTSIMLTCDFFQKVVNVSGSQGSKLIFSDSHLVNGWKENSFSNCGTQDLNNCNLTIQTLLQSANQVNHFWIIAQGAVSVHSKNDSDKIDEGGESTCLKLKYQETTVEDFEQTPTPIITSTSGGKFEFNVNNAQCNQTLANYIIKNITDAVHTSTYISLSQAEIWLIAIFSFIFFTIQNLLFFRILCKQDKQHKELNKLGQGTVGYKALQTEKKEEREELIEILSS
jgi:hypothetical protein